MIKRFGIFAFATLAFCTEQNRILVHTGKLDDVTKGEMRSLPRVIAGQRFVLMPFGVWKSLQHCGDLPRQRLRGNRFRENPQARSLSGVLSFKLRAKNLQELGPRADPSAIADYLGTIRIVERQD